MSYGEIYHRDHKPILLKTWQVMFYGQNHIGRASHFQPLLTMLGTQGDSQTAWDKKLDQCCQCTALNESRISQELFGSPCCHFFFPVSSIGLVRLLHRQSSTEILPDYWGTFCEGVRPKSVFSFLVAVGFEPTSLSLRSVRLNRYPILIPPYL